ncbi:MULTISPECIES: hypothetical protein [unclassified Helicobacter]|nr:MULTISPECIES: hypothetical protein [unclassified Helicobacter]
MTKNTICHYISKCFPVIASGSEAIHKDSLNHQIALQNLATLSAKNGKI